MGEAMVTKDVVCGMIIREEDAPFESLYGGRTFYFCSEQCQETFEEKPEEFATTAA
jgi:YHS domain-containing protein